MLFAWLGLIHVNVAVVVMACAFWPRAEAVAALVALVTLAAWPRARESAVVGGKVGENGDEDGVRVLSTGELAGVRGRGGMVGSDAMRTTVVDRIGAARGVATERHLVRGVFHLR